jgi:hypothetical protein
MLFSRRHNQAQEFKSKNNRIKTKRHGKSAGSHEYLRRSRKRRTKNQEDFLLMNIHCLKKKGKRRNCFARKTKKTSNKTMKRERLPRKDEDKKAD